MRAYVAVCPICFCGFVTGSEDLQTEFALRRSRVRWSAVISRSKKLKFLLRPFKHPASPCVHFLKSEKGLCCIFYVIYTLEMLHRILMEHAEKSFMCFKRSGSVRQTQTNANYIFLYY